MTLTKLIAALEKAAEVLAVPYECANPTCRECNRKRSRAVVLAFLKAMPALTRHKVSTGDGGYTYTPEGWNLHTLAAVVEKERT